MWLGHGDWNGLTCTFWSDSVRDAVLIVDVALASPQPSGTPHLACYFETEGLHTNRTASLRFPHDLDAGFAHPVAAHFPLRLSPGYNYVELSAVSSSPPRPLSETDHRPALLLLKGVRIEPSAADTETR